jgi:hypothetical protein
MPAVMNCERHGKCLLVTAYDAPSGVPLVAFGIAPHSRCGAPLWRRLHDRALPSKTDPEQCPIEPWLAVRMEIGIAEHLEATNWLGDWERCLAWAWLSRAADGEYRRRAAATPVPKTETKPHDVK